MESARIIGGKKMELIGFLLFQSTLLSLIKKNVNIKKQQEKTRPRQT